MQSKVPENSSVLTLVYKPYLLDFTKNNILTVHQPFIVLPFDNLEIFKSSGEFRNSLLKNNISYVFITIADEISEAKLKLSLDRTDKPSGLVQTVWYYYDLFYYYVLEFRNTNKVLYTDGFNYVIDISEEN
jgi:hypothetical protein